MPCARRRLAAQFRRTALTLPVEIPWRNRSLIRTLVRRDILSRYSGSFGGAFWAVLNPLLLMLTYFFVFGLVLQSRVRSDPSVTGFAFYFLAGMLPWLAFSEALGARPASWSSTATSSENWFSRWRHCRSIWWSPDW